jgi:hypothetical protein
MTVTTSERLTWDDLVELEPRLGDLEARVREAVAAAGKKRRWCATTAWYGPHLGGGFRSELARLVGWQRVIPGYVAPPPPGWKPWGFRTMSEAAERYARVEAARAAAVARLSDAEREREAALGSSAAFDVVYRRLYELLPECRGCRCG